LSLRFHARTDVGLKRKQNEDSLLAAEEFGVFVVADGVGGRKAGELASAITVNTFQAYAPTLKAAVDAYATAPGRETRLAVLSQLDQACNAASRRVYESAASTGRQGMTTTLVAAAVGGGSAFLCHVGDSRIYLLRDGALKQITEDHSMINELIRTGTMTAEEANNTRYRNVITRAIGLYPTVRPDTMHLELLDGDRLLLCSDGLSDMIEDDHMAQLLGGPKVPAAVDALLQAALDGGGRDNITVVALEPEALLQAETVAARARAMENLFLFGDLPDHARLRVGRIVSERFVAPDEVVVRQGDPGDTLFVIVQGQFSVRVNGKEVAIAEAGEHFGELALVDEEPRSADIVAKGFGHLIGIDRVALQEFCMMEPALGNALLWRLLATLGQRLRTANVRLASAPK
jgi:serine/threonine protein phosphatase PrpC